MRQHSIDPRADRWAAADRALDRLAVLLILALFVGFLSAALGEVMTALDGAAP